MTQFFVRATVPTRMPDGRHHALVRGIREVPDQLANSPEGHKLGIIPISEMTDNERAEFGMLLQLDVDPNKERPHEEEVVTAEEVITPVAPTSASEVSTGPVIVTPAATPEESTH